MQPPAASLVESHKRNIYLVSTFCHLPVSRKERTLLTRTQALAAGGKAAGTSATPGAAVGGLGAWLKPGWPSGTPAAAAEMAPQAASASAAPSGSDTDTS